MVTRPPTKWANDPEKWADDLTFVLKHNAGLLRDALSHKARLAALYIFVDQLQQQLGELPDVDRAALEPLNLIAGELDRFMAHRKSDVLKPSDSDKSAGLTIVDHALRLRAIQYVECYRVIGLSDPEAFAKVAAIFKAYRGHKGQFGKATVKEWWHEAHKFGRFANQRAAVDETWNRLDEKQIVQLTTVKELDRYLVAIEAERTNPK